MFLKYLCYHSICLLISITVADENTAKMSTQATSFACRSIIFIFTLPCENYNMNGLQHRITTWNLPNSLRSSSEVLISKRENCKLGWNLHGMRAFTATTENLGSRIPWECSWKFYSKPNHRTKFCMCTLFVG